MDTAAEEVAASAALAADCRHYTRGCFVQTAAAAATSGSGVPAPRQPPPRAALNAAAASPTAEEMNTEQVPMLLCCAQTPEQRRRPPIRRLSHREVPHSPPCAVAIPCTFGSGPLISRVDLPVSSARPYPGRCETAPEQGRRGLPSRTWGVTAPMTDRFTCR